MIMKLRSRQTRMTEIIQDDFPTRSRSRNIVARIPFRPRYVGNIYGVDLSNPTGGLGGFAANHTAKIEVFRAPAAFDFHSLEDFFPAEKSVRAFFVN